MLDKFVGVVIFIKLKGGGKDWFFFELLMIKYCF